MAYTDYNNYDEQNKLSLLIDKLDGVINAFEGKSSGGGSSSKKTYYANIELTEEQTFPTTTMFLDTLTTTNVTDESGNAVSISDIADDVQSGEAVLKLTVTTENTAVGYKAITTYSGNARHISVTVGETLADSGYIFSYSDIYNHTTTDGKTVSVGIRNYAWNLMYSEGSSEYDNVGITASYAVLSTYSAS